MEEEAEEAEEEEVVGRGAWALTGVGLGLCGRRLLGMQWLERADSRVERRGLAYPRNQARKGGGTCSSLAQA
jgi:hypothetical protein